MIIDSSALYVINGKIIPIYVNFKEDVRMFVPTLYQFSIFGEFPVSLSPTLVTSLMSKINEATGEIFLPNIISSQQIDIATNRITTGSNLGFITQNQKYTIAILDKRIDVSYNKISTESQEKSVFYLMARKVVEVILSELAVSANRVALNIEWFSPHSDSESKNDIGKKIISCSNYYKDRSLFEWSTRMNSQEKISLAADVEELNIISDITTVQHAQSGTNGIVLHVDINTLAQNNATRFNDGNLSLFIEKTLPIVDSIFTGVKEQICNEF